MQLIVVFGPIASGKLTTARELAALTGLPLFHNHLVVDAVLSVFPFGSAPFVELRDQFWTATFEAAARADRSLIFTFAPEPTVPRDFLDRAAAAVRRLGGEVRFVELQVGEEEQAARVGNPDRAAFRKLSDVATLAEVRRAGLEAEPYAMPVPDVVVDTETSSPRRSAELVARALALPQALS